VRKQWPPEMRVNPTNLVSMLNIEEREKSEETDKIESFAVDECLVP
jgi:hypothetical protein